MPFGTVAHPLDPLLGSLTDNGGPKVGAPGFAITLQTDAPLSGSPAIGKGIIPGIVPTDERGFPSVVNGKVNVGAVSQAPDDSASASSVTVGGILSLAQRLDGTGVVPQTKPSSPDGLSVSGVDQLFSSKTGTTQQTPRTLAGALGKACSGDDWLTGPF
jgi:hypothetical protein